MPRVATWTTDEKNSLNTAVERKLDFNKTPQMTVNLGINKETTCINTSQ